MTKLRSALSIDTALARIAGQLPGGWAEMAGLTGYAERTVRAWGDVDRDENINLPAAVALDIAFQAAGGTGAPIFEAYSDLVRAAQAERFGCKHELHRAAIVLMKENGDAEQALLEAALPGAGPAEVAKAQRELLQARNIGDSVLVRLGRQPP